FDLKLDNSNGLGLNIVKNILNKYNIKYEILHGENYFIFKIKIIS
ncbi:sensor histidine kinase, partial [Streptococcus agalactiae]